MFKKTYPSNLAESDSGGNVPSASIFAMQTGKTRYFQQTLFKNDGDQLTM